jgi:hypothetical protein
VEKISTLLYTIGDDCLKFFENLKNTVEKIPETLEDILVNKENGRGKLILMKQKRGESANEYEHPM